MKVINYLFIIGLVFIFLGCTWIIARSLPRKDNNSPFKLKQTNKTLDTSISVKGKKVLFIGDSHTSNHVFGWQVILTEKTGMVMTNTAVGGKMTPWMYEIAKKNINNQYDYCFVYGGANDCFNSADINVTLGYIQKIADLCVENNVKCFVLTGFNPITCVKTNSNYPKLYDSLQKSMLVNLKNCQVIDCREAVVRRNCWDWMCHMNKEGHESIANCVLKTVKFKTIK